MFEVSVSLDNGGVCVIQANLLSAHRKLVSRVDVIEVTSELSGRGDHITLFVFSDSLEVSKAQINVLLCDKLMYSIGILTKTSPLSLLFVPYFQQ